MADTVKMTLRQISPGARKRVDTIGTALMGPISLALTDNLLLQARGQIRYIDTGAC